MTAPAIVVEGIGKHFGDVEALRDVSFDVPRGTVLGLLGPNGAGKTTSVRILTTLLPPDTGTAHVLGRDVSVDRQAVRSTIGLAGQYAAVDEFLTGRENLHMVGRLTHLGKSEIRARADELLEQFNLADAADDRQVRTYSGGMRRRLDLAAALVHRPPVLFLDEPTTGLDPQGRNDLWATIEQLVDDGTTLLLTTQYLEEADRLADRIVVIDHGTVIAEGTAGELKSGLGSTVLELGFTGHEETARAAGLLDGIGQPSVDGHLLRLTVDEGARSMLAAVRALDDAGLEPTTAALREPTLDDVFLSLTGRPAEDAAPEEEEEAAAAGTRTRARTRTRGAA